MGCGRLDWSDFKTTSQIRAAEQGQGGSGTNGKIYFQADF